MKNVRLILVLAACLAFSAAASAYDINKATKAAGKALEKVRHTTEFYFYNIPPDQKAKPEVILKFVRDCQTAKQAGAIGSEKLSTIFDVLRVALETSEEKFDGLVLIIVAAEMDPKKFDALLLPRGITPVYATY